MVWFLSLVTTFDGGGLSVFRPSYALRLWEGKEHPILNNAIRTKYRGAEGWLVVQFLGLTGAHKSLPAFFAIIEA